jgi:hypothetical protein
MNFKPTKLKMIFFAVVFIIVDLALARLLICLDGCLPWYFNGLDFRFLFISFIAGILLYLIWSLFEKK